MKLQRNGGIKCTSVFIYNPIHTFMSSKKPHFHTKPTLIFPKIFHFTKKKNNLIKFIFTMFGGKGMGSGGGGSVLRSVGRAVTRANVPLQEPISSSSSSSATNTTSTTSPRNTQKRNSNNNLSISSYSSPFASYNIPMSSISGLPNCSSSSNYDEFDWVSVDGPEEENPRGFVDVLDLGSVPSEDEVQNAVSALQQVFNPASYSQLIRDRFASELDSDDEHQVVSPSGLLERVSSVGSELDWMEPSLYVYNSKMLQPHGSERVFDAFHLLQTEPLVRKMVISLSSDRAVWNAILNNEVVRELRDSFSSAEGSSPKSLSESSKDSTEEINIVRWIFNSSKGKIMEVFDKITTFVNEMFQPREEGKATTGGDTDPFKEKLRTSFMLSIMVLLVVVVARANRV